MRAETEREKKEALLELIRDHPDLPILPMVSYEVVAGDDYCYWAGSWGSAQVQKVYYGEEGIHFYDDTDEDEICRTLNDKPYTGGFDDAYDHTDEENLAAYKALDWVECIVVYIGLPDR